MTTTEDRIAIIRNYVPRLREQIKGLSDDQLTTAYVEGEWTIAQNVHHLFDAHTNAYQLFKRVLTEDDAKLLWPDQDACANLPDASHANLEPSLLGLSGMHSRWSDLLSNVTDWSKSGTSIKSGKIYSVDDLLTMYSNHCNNHIQQIQDVLDAMD